MPTTRWEEPSADAMISGMRTLGMLGGMGWPSTADAYRMINEEVGRRLGGDHSASLLIRSFDFAEIHRLQDEDRWEDAGSVLAEGARSLRTAGADGLVLCTNTMHRVAWAIEEAVDIPLLHIADATVRAVRSEGIERVGLLATRFTMEQDFYRGRLESRGLRVSVPPEDARAEVHRVIFDELVKGLVVDDSRHRIASIAGDLVTAGAEGIIAGCTEIELLLRPEDVDAPFFPTTRIQVMDAVDWMLAD